MKTAVVQTTKPTLKPLNFFINVLVSYLVAMSLKQLDWIVDLILQPSTTSSTIDLQTKKLKVVFQRTGDCDHMEKNHQPSKHLMFLIDMQH